MKVKDFERTHSFFMPIYPMKVVFCLVTKENEQYLKSKHQHCEARVEKDDQTIYIYLKKNAELSTVVHELFHATEFIMLEVGQTISTSPNEAWAYLIEYLTVKYQEFIKK